MKASFIIDKLFQVQERRLGTPRDYMFHGTSSMNLRSILKKGLVPDPKEKVWDWEEEKGSEYGPNLASYGGVYLTMELETAGESARRATFLDAGEPIIITALVQRRSGILDEDTLTNNAFSSVFNSFVRMVGETWRPGAAKIALNDKSHLTKIVNGVKGILMTISPDDDIERSVSDDDLMEFVIAGLERITSYGNIDDEEDDWKSSRPTDRTEEAEKKYRSVVDKLTRKLRRLAVGAKTIRMTETLNYRGRNRIVTIIQLEPYEYTFVYGSRDDLPEWVLREFDERFKHP